MKITNKSVLNDPVLAKIIVSILVKRIGGVIQITQNDIDDVAYNILNEYHCENGAVELSFKKKGYAS